MEIHGAELNRSSIFGALRLLIAKCVRPSALREMAWTLLAGRWIKLPSFPASDQPTVVLTVAHGDGYLAAMRLAKQEGWPLVSIFHDWWPNLAAPPGAIRRFIEKRFRDLYNKSDVALCVSEGMQSTLGEHLDSRILYPIPNETALSDFSEVSQASSPFKILFFGNLGVYGDLVGQALEIFYEHPEIRFEARGGGASFSNEFETRMRASGRLLSHTSDVDSFQEWAGTADAFLIPQSFAKGRRLEMETNFPSKLLEASRYGKPLIVWGPTWASAIRWANDSHAALAVTKPNAENLLHAVEKIAVDAAEQKRLSKAVIQQANTDFSPNHLQEMFIRVLREAADR